MEIHPDNTSESETERAGPVAGKRGHWIARLGLALYSGPVWGMIITMVAMIRSFMAFDDKRVTPESAPTHTHPSVAELAKDIATAAHSSVAGVYVGLVGLTLILIALFGKKNREPWFFWWSVFLSAFWCLMVLPYGLVAGLPLLIILFLKRGEFLNPQAHIKPKGWVK